MVEGLDGEGLGLQPLQVGSIPTSTTAQKQTPLGTVFSPAKPDQK